MAKSATFDGQFISLLFNGTGIPNLADNTVTAPLTSLYCALHTADPTASGNQSSSEATYPGYARAAVPRTVAGWTVTGGSVSPTATISFPIGTGGSGSATFWSVGVASAGATTILYSGLLSPAITLGSGVTPQLSTATAVVES